MSEKSLNIEEIKSIELSLLKKIHEICCEQGIKYSLAGGTLLGAVRHKGFIPWDDDVDILMLREDYDKFIEYCIQNKTDFNFLSTLGCKEYGQPFVKVCDTNTYLVENYGIRGNYTQGVYVDIFPIDGMGNTKAESISAFNKKRFWLELLVAANWTKFRRSKTNKLSNEPFRFAFFVLSRFVNPNTLAKRIESNLQKQKKKSFDFSGSYYGSYRQKEIIKTSVYEETMLLRFEDQDFYCLKNYDEYLKCLYGNYMQLPPIEKQVTHHSFKAYKKETE